MSYSCPEQLILDKITEDMADERLALLNPGSHPGRDMDYMVVFIHRTGILPDNGHGRNPLGPAGAQGLHQIARFSRRRYADEHVALPDADDLLIDLSLCGVIIPIIPSGIWIDKI